VRKHGQWLEARPKPRSKRLTPHVFRHTAAVHLREAGVEPRALDAATTGSVSRESEILTGRRTVSEWNSWVPVIVGARGWIRMSRDQGVGISKG